MHAYWGKSMYYTLCVLGGIHYMYVLGRLDTLCVCIRSDGYTLHVLGNGVHHIDWE